MTERYLTVTALTKYLKRKFDIDPHLRNVLLKGEISNFNHHSRGHMYFTLKDDKAKIKAAMFSHKNRALKFMPENGMNVLVKGEVSVYEVYGEYQLYVQEMEPDGIGSLYLAYEQLKEELEKKGYFSPTLKKLIPRFPKHIAIITSPNGAAIRDILTTIRRRYPIVNTTIIPAIVQGTEAGKSISHAIQRANDYAAFDLIILGRGGGSIEDLWGFNEKIVAEAIFHSKTPIISAVGHETDHTISDFIADLRAPTPTGAAERAVPSREELHAQISRYQRSIVNIINQLIRNQKEKLNRLTDSYAFRYPNNLIKQKEQELDMLLERINRSQTSLLKEKQVSFQQFFTRFINQHPKKGYNQAIKEQTHLHERLQQSFAKRIKEKEQELLNKMDKLILLNPLEVMKRGFAIPYDDAGNVLMSSKKAQIDDHIRVKMSDGALKCQVLEIEVNPDDR